MKNLEKLKIPLILPNGLRKIKCKALYHPSVNIPIPLNIHVLLKCKKISSDIC